MKNSILLLMVLTIACFNKPNVVFNLDNIDKARLNNAFCSYKIDFHEYPNIEEFNEFIKKASPFLYEKLKNQKYNFIINEQIQEVSFFTSKGHQINSIRNLSAVFYEMPLSDCSKITDVRNEVIFYTSDSLSFFDLNRTTKFKNIIINYNNKSNKISFDDLLSLSKKEVKPKSSSVMLIKNNNAWETEFITVEHSQEELNRLIVLFIKELESSDFIKKNNIIKLIIPIKYYTPEQVN